MPHAAAPIPRLVPERALPPYSYVTGRWPHPLRDPAGHLFGQPAEWPAPVEPNGWTSSSDYLFGCDLFNHGYYWEAHETWEGLWHACGRSGATADFLKGLIKLAAAGVKAREGNPAGVTRHAARAGELFASVQSSNGSSRYLGLEFAELIALTEQVVSGFTLPTPTDAPVQIVFAFRLLPRLGD